MLKLQLLCRRDQGSTRVNDILHKFPFSLPYSGYVNRVDGKVDNQGTNGYFWSAGSDSSTYARYLNYRGNYTYPEGSYYKTDGYSVRCVVFLPSVVGAGSIYWLFSEWPYLDLNQNTYIPDEREALQCMTCFWFKSWRKKCNICWPPKSNTLALKTVVFRPKTER